MKTIIEDIRAKRELYRKEAGSCSMLQAIMSDGTSAVILYRMMQWNNKKGLKLIAYMFQWLNKLLNGCVIGIKADFQPRLIIAHPIGVVINSKVTGGADIVIESGVVIGDNKGKSPTLGNNIFIGSGAKIFGDITIGNDILVGANAVVTKSFHDSCILLGIPAQSRRTEDQIV